MKKYMTFLTIFYRRSCPLLLLVCAISYWPVAYAQEDAQELPVEASSAISVATDKVEAIDTVTALNNKASNLQEITPTPASTLPHNLSPWGMFMTADNVVKTVMIGLTIVSLLTWTILVSKSIELGALKRLLKNNLSKITVAQTLADAANSHDIVGVGREFIDAAEAELQLSSDMLKKDDSKEAIKEGIKERVGSSLSRIEVASTRRMMVGTGLLATIGAISPFVGLFGTVWGIMDSFISISEAHTTNLAVVAPGIAEALLATALGLVAAIPAVVIYNHFSRKIAGTKALVSDSSAAIMRLVSRDLDRGTQLRMVKTTSPAQKGE